MQFNYWTVICDISFWTRLTKKKIDEYKLSSEVKPLFAKYRLSAKSTSRSQLTIDAYSFQADENIDKNGPVDYVLKGSFLMTNTIEEFKAFNQEKQEGTDPFNIEKLIAKQEENIYKLISGESVPQISEFFLLIFGDLKKHKYVYQFYSTAIPITGYSIIQSKSAADAFSPERIASLNSYFKGYVDSGKILPQFSVIKAGVESTLKEFIASKGEGEYLFIVRDTTNSPKITGYHTSTILSIFAYLLKQKLVQPAALSKISILLLKQLLIYSLQVPYSFKSSEVITLDLSAMELANHSLKLSHNKKIMDLDLAANMDQRALAKEAVDLNVKLMKWRLMPGLNIPKIEKARCLLFGAGTLGCQLARNLIGWGIKNITFIDYSKVSFSNPVRQTLYEYEDTLNGGKPKAQTAAQKLRKIYPELNSKGYSIPIPMPGHYVTKQQHIIETFKYLDQIEELVREHDVLFLLLDSREARWLPTVLANKYDKACITVGLGFDSYVIVRHGVPPQFYNPGTPLKYLEIHKERICCYFCNDIVTPQNTMKDRTLDQMCTVTKPGLSFIASAYAAQLYVSLLHHPLEHHAPANEDSNLLPVTQLGKLPHHLRGNLSDFETSIFYGKAFDQCVACSKYILDEYLSNRDEFMLKVLNDPSFIHTVVKLKDQLDGYEGMEGIIQIDDQELEAWREKEKKEEEEKKEENTDKKSSQGKEEHKIEPAETKSQTSSQKKE